ncbi:helix-turn-helix domain-containing protein [Antarcticimicrobium sediminis]|uniref:Helix-turn-helix domain-containing protein n=1 Tax=Antarcticimicrobium sediminis TaxID=2546227 RepID=A0A4R5EIJ0_9RHOB|nr:helix-turn-helix domain-containing protein [Antarcticimicrobium sediminis]TDE34142.1 helix-turn-helix domain-containing protein [Antarcticimicrobium sediminis]
MKNASQAADRMGKDVSEQAARKMDFTPPAERRVILSSDWERQRWGWLESVRRDEGLNPMARLVAHVLVLDFANHKTMRCDPPMWEIADVIGCSEDTVKRAIGQLVKARWIVREQGIGRGISNGYGFLTRAKIVRLKGGKSAPRKGGRNAPTSGSVMGADLHRKGGKSAPPYIKDKPYKNHKGSQGASERPKNPMVVAEAERAVAAFRGGRSDAIAELPIWVLNYVITAELLTPEERLAAGLS